MKIVSSQAMALIDRRAQEEYHIPSLLLMENAGIKAWLYIKEEIFRGVLPGGRLVFVAGKGNNGGDAFVMARQLLLDGLEEITIILASGEPLPCTNPAINLEICHNLGIRIIDYTNAKTRALQEIHNAYWIFDGIAGTGIKGALNTALAELVEEINSTRCRIIAIDVPSGLGDDYKKGNPCVKAQYTLTMGLPKRCLYLPDARSYCGKIIVIKLGFPPELITNPAIPGELLEEQDLAQLNPPLQADTYKSKRGHLAVFAGSIGTTGAAWLCCHAAGRSRIGLVSLFADDEIYGTITSAYHSVMVKKWDTVTENLKKHSAFLIGPGWGLTTSRKEWLKVLLALKMPTVVDADGLTLLAQLLHEKKLDLDFHAVLTPHPGEFSKLTGIPVDKVLANPLEPVRLLSSSLNAVIVLKGHITYLAAPTGEYCILDGMNPALATAGTGDVLAGLIGAFLAAGMKPFDAARKGVLVHSLAGRLAYQQQGWFLAEDLIPCISQILKQKNEE